jgi:hypothetical protein
MSYLDPVRLHFAGRFQSDPVTVNNDVRHFDNARFKPEYQETRVPGGDYKGWWNPDGSGAFRLVGCKVTRVCYADGGSATTPQVDPVVGMWIADANERVAGKLVDLDPQQQLVSEVWGMLLRLSDGERDVFSGRFHVAAFSDLWSRAKSLGPYRGDSGASCFYQSVIGPVDWGALPDSRFLRELSRAAPQGLLSIRFMLDGYNSSAHLPDFTLGRIVGTLGPYEHHEPRHFVAGRHLLPRVANQAPVAPLGFVPCVVDSRRDGVLADFGNALPTATVAGPLADVGDVEVGYLEADGGFHSLGAADYRRPDWYESTAGIQAFPKDRPLTTEERRALEHSRLAVAVAGQVVLMENEGGVHLRADTFVHRLDAGETARVELYATRYGKPYPGATVVAWHDSSGLQPGVGPGPLGPVPAFGTPVEALTFEECVHTDRDGRVTLELHASSPGAPRGYIDGQVYGVRYLLKEVARLFTEGLPPAFGYNPADFISVLVWDAFPVPALPSWHEHLQPIFQQYANLYPVMGRILDLGNYEELARHTQLLAFAFGLPREDPNHMPVTRALSGGKRRAILEWLRNPGPDGKPRQGTPVPRPAVEPRVLAASSSEPQPSTASPEESKTLISKQRRQISLPARLLQRIQSE